MVSMDCSLEYTLLALDSFAHTTELYPEDTFILIDNGNGAALKSRVAEGTWPWVQYVCNQSPLSFAENVNYALRVAREKQSVLYFLNNDLVFFSGWESALQPSKPGVTVSASNQNFSYRTNAIAMEGVHSLEEYIEFRDHFESMVQTHKSRVSGFHRVLTTPYYCVRIPPEVYLSVGFFDGNFSSGGGEDTDYSIRCYQKGFEVSVALESFVLHFVGRSTWRGGETESETKAREAKYFERLITKWGRELTMLFTCRQHSNPEMLQLYDEGNGFEVLRRLQV